MQQRVSRRRWHYIYKTTCITTGKHYVGMHSTDDLEDGYLGSGRYLRYSIRKHGKENHKKEILEFLQDRSQLRKREEQIVNEEFLKDLLCMNLRTGGGGFDSKTASTVAKKAWDFNRSRLLKNTEKARLVSHKDLSKFIESSKKTRFKSGQRQLFSWSGRKHKPETIKKMKISHSKNKPIGEKNGSFGSRWMKHDYLGIKRICQNDVTFYLSNDWVFGRK